MHGIFMDGLQDGGLRQSVINQFTIKRDTIRCGCDDIKCNVPWIIYLRVPIGRSAQQNKEIHSIQIIAALLVNQCEIIPLVRLPSD
jgi:hypothetical protein